MTLNLKSKLIGIIIAVIIIMTAVFGYFMKTAVYRTLEDEIDKRALSIGKHFAELSAEADLTESTSVLQTHLADYIATESYLAYIVVFGGNGQIQAHSFPAAIPPEILNAIRTNSGSEPIHIFRLSDGMELEDFAVKIGTGREGSVHIGIYETKIRQTINSLMLKLTPLLLAVALVGILVAYLLASAITRPLRVLSNGVRQLTRGNLEFMIEVSSRDEIGHLAEAFNQMTGNLRESTVSRDYMENLIDSMNDVLVVISPEGLIRSVNRAYCELFGFRPDEVIGRSVEEFDEQDAPLCMYRAYTRMNGSDSVHGMESACLTSQGELVPMLFSLAVMKDDEGAPLAIICAAQNISNIRKIQDALWQKQAELEEVNRNLEEIVASRTAELAIGNEGLRAEVAERQKKTEELREARDIAEKANRAKSEFLANMSHEMRTPLNSIIGGTEYLESATLAPDQQRCLTMIQQAGESLLVLVNDLIDLSRIEAGQLEIVSRQFDLPDTLERVMQMLGREAERKSLQLTLDNHDVPRYLLGDRMRLQQVLVNLISNAVKFTNAGGSVSVSVNGGAETEGKVPVTFLIRDTGIGISADKLDLIFETFTQADASITRRYGGSGLGLAISRKLVHAMGGTILVESQTGAGSSFTVTIAFQRTEILPTPHSGPPLAAVKDERPPEAASQSAGMKRVLLVDDSMENRQLMRLLLLKLPIVMDEAGNGKEALELFRQNSYDLVLMDIQMPIMDGYTATRLIRKSEVQEGRKKTAIVALTAHAYESDIMKCIEAGCDDHVAKPFKKKTLLKCVATYIPGISYE